MHIPNIKYPALNSYHREPKSQKTHWSNAPHDTALAKTSSTILALKLQRWRLMTAVEILPCSSTQVFFFFSLKTHIIKMHILYKGFQVKTRFALPLTTCHMTQHTCPRFHPTGIFWLHLPHTGRSLGWEIQWAFRSPFIRLHSVCLYRNELVNSNAKWMNGF